MNSPTYDWKRFWIPRDSRYSLLDGGYLADPDSERGKIFKSQVVPFSRISHHVCLVLLGEPGMGKTTAMESEREEIERCIADDGGIPLWKDLNVFASDVTLRQKLFDSEGFTSWATGTHTLHLFLDSLDECFLRIETIVPLLLDELRNKDLGRLRLRIACRTAEWPAALENGLKSLYNDGLQIFELAPLRKRDVAEAARCSGLDPETFLAQVDQREAVPFAIKPVTLKMLLKMSKQGEFPSSLADLYRKGCKGLCEESNVARIGAHRSGTLSPQQRVFVARRIAAMMAFCPRTTILVGPAVVDAEPTDLPLDEIVCAGEPGGTQDGGVDVSTEAVREVLDTGLFSARGPNRLGWAHYTYLEFLASEFVLAHGLVSEQTASLVMHPRDPSRVVPQLHGVAAWLASADKVIFEKIGASDPQVLLRADTGTMDDFRKARLLDGYLGQLEDKTASLDWGLSHYWVRLKHADLARQLEPYIAGKEHNIQARLAAIDIAEACETRELQEILAALALDATENTGVRESAAAAVARLGDRSTKLKLRPLADGDRADRSDSLKTQALRALWPEDLKTEELFQLLTAPTDPYYSGSYPAFVQEIARDLTPDALPCALEWVEQHPSRYHNDYFWAACEEIVGKAWECLDDPSVLFAFAKVARARMKLCEPICDGRLLSADSEKHRRVVQSIIELEASSAEDIPAQAGQTLTLDWWREVADSPPLVRCEDLAWVIDNFKSADAVSTRRCWGQILKAIVDFHTGKRSLDPLIEAAESTPVLGEMFARVLGSIEIQSERARALREEEAKSRRYTSAPPREGPPLAERMAGLLARCEDGEIDVFSDLLYHMAFGDKATDAVDYWTKELDQFPGWRAADVPTRARIVDLGKRYLTNRECKPAAWTGENTIGWPEMAACHTLHLLEQVEPSWLEQCPTHVWQRWGAIILNEPNLENRPTKLLEIAFRCAPDEILARLEALIESEDRAHQGAFAARRLSRFWNRRIEATLIGKARDERLAPSTAGDLLLELLGKGSCDGTQLALSFLPDSLPDGGRMRGLAIEAAFALLLCNPDLAWLRVWHWIVEHPEFGRDILTRLAKAQHGQWKLGNELCEDSVADLFVWLSRAFPRSEDPASRKTGPMSDRDQVADFREALLDRLSARATPEAVAALTKIDRELHLPDLPYHILRAKKAMLEKNWSSRTPRDLLRLAQDKRNRLVSSGRELKSIVLESLRRYHDDLHGENPSNIFLWDQQRQKGTWCPKEENAVSDHIAQHLDRDLRQRGVVVNREVVIRRKPGQRTDIHVDAVDGQERLKVIIEVKGCWNPQVATAMQDQLKDRYLRENECSDGIYLVAWFDCPSWDPDDRRCADAAAWCSSIEEARKQLGVQARDLSTDGCSLAAFVLDGRL